MEKYRAIPEGYMRIGEMAKKAGVTVRTLQYYDKEGLLSPSAESEGGFRLYTDKDLARLIQILMMKQLGFPLSDIKKRLAQLDSPADVVGALAEQAAQIRERIEALTETLEAIESLKAEILQMDSVDFKKYSDILGSLLLKNEQYWMIKYFDDDVLEKIREGMDMEKAEAITETMNRLYGEAAKLQKEGVLPESEKGQSFAKEFWGLLVDITGGDMDLLQRMSDHSDKIDDYDEVQSLKASRHFTRSAVEIYLGNLFDREGDV